MRTLDLGTRRAGPDAPLAHTRLSVWLNLYRNWHRYTVLPGFGKYRCGSRPDTANNAIGIDGCDSSVSRCPLHINGRDILKRS